MLFILLFPFSYSSYNFFNIFLLFSYLKSFTLISFFICSYIFFFFFLFFFSFSCISKAIIAFSLSISFFSTFSFFITVVGRFSSILVVTLLLLILFISAYSASFEILYSLAILSIYSSCSIL